MKDLTGGSIARHVWTMAPPIFAGITLTLLCGLIDVYFVSELGDAAVAGVGAASNVGFLVSALTQVLSVGTVALISHAVGRKDQGDANLVFNQSLGLTVVLGLTTWIVGSMVAHGYMRSIAADEATVAAGTTYLLWFMPALALQFAMLVMASALRGTGIVRPTMIVQALTVAINVALAPVFITGWGTGRALGVAGAGLATSIAVLIGVLTLGYYFQTVDRYVNISPAQWWPRAAQWKRIWDIGWPAGGELAIVFGYMAIIYYALSKFGAAAQAGFGIGSRVLGLFQVPAMACAFAGGSIAGQSFGAGNYERVKETFRVAAMIGSALMVAFTILAQGLPDLLLRAFSSDPATIAVGALFLRMISLNLVAQGLIFVCSSIFQALGNTKPVLFSSVVRLVSYGMPLVWMAAAPTFRIEHVWYLSIASTTLQAALSVWLLRVEFRTRLSTLVR
jgi:putative MATE family efflux protein